MLSWPCNLIYLPSDGWSYPQQGRWRAPPPGGGRGEQEESVTHPALALSLYLGSLSAKPDPDTSINLVGIPPPTPAPATTEPAPSPSRLLTTHLPAGKQRSRHLSEATHKEVAKQTGNQIRPVGLEKKTRPRAGEAGGRPSHGSRSGQRPRGFLVPTRAFGPREGTFQGT